MLRNSLPENRSLGAIHGLGTIPPRCLLLIGLRVLVREKVG